MFSAVGLVIYTEIGRGRERERARERERERERGRSQYFVIFHSKFTL